MRAILLVAGRGTRLAPLTDECPKCLVPWRGRPILAHAVDALARCGIKDVTLVSGYRPDQLAPLGMQTRHNPEFATTNMVYSLFCAEDLLEGDDVLVVYGDIVFRPRLVSSLIESDAPISVVVDRSWKRLWEMRMGDPLADAETLRLDSRGYIREIGRRPESYDEIEGQYVGLIRFSRVVLPELRLFWHRLDPECTHDGRRPAQMYMTSFLQALVDAGHPVKAAPVDGGWIEFDSLEDVDAYRRNPELVDAILGPD